MEQRITDRTNWNRGPWDNEPDRVDFITSGYAAFTLRGPHGSWCGYVGVPVNHPVYGKDYGDNETETLDVHGGITYASKCAGAICHIPAPGMPDEVWWLGFDTAHYMDLSPTDNFHETATYKDIGYIIAECVRFAKQLREMETNANA
jgi:hypothetical protein